MWLNLAWNSKNNLIWFTGQRDRNFGSETLKNYEIMIELTTEGLRDALGVIKKHREERREIMKKYTGVLNEFFNS
jgi:hypothetical protein